MNYGFVPMAPIVPVSAVGQARIEHFNVSQKESDFTRIRDAIGHRGEYVPAGDYVRLFVGRELMMSDTPFERNTNRDFLDYARGRVLVPHYCDNLCWQRYRFPRKRRKAWEVVNAR